MRLFHKKSGWERVADELANLPRAINSTVNALDGGDAVAPASAGKAGGATKAAEALKRRVPTLRTKKALRSGLIATGSVAGLTLASAVVSALRRRGEGSRNQS
jgi:hypothetical protein